MRRRTVGGEATSSRRHDPNPRGRRPTGPGVYRASRRPLRGDLSARRRQGRLPRASDTGPGRPTEARCRFWTTPPLEGLGADLGTLKRICEPDKRVLDLLDRVTQQPAHRPVKAEAVTVDNVHGYEPE